MSNDIKAQLKTGLHISAFRTDDDIVKRIISQTLDANATIPISFLDEIGKHIAKDTGSYGTVNPFQLLRLNITDEGGVEAAAQFAKEINKYPRAYWAFYRALVQSMDELVKNPGIPAITHKTNLIHSTKKRTLAKDHKVDYAVVSAPFNKTVQLNPIELIPTIPRIAIHLTGQWKALSEATITAKKALGGKPVFWHHTGEASNAFHAAASSHLSRLTLHSFKAKMSSEPRIVLGSSAKTGPGKFAVKAIFRIDLGIPAWNKKMDTLVTLPFATLRTDISTLQGTGVSSVQKKDGGYTIVSKGYKKKLELKGIDRLLVAEAYRPWLRDLSAQAGGALQSFIKGTAVTVSKSGVAQGEYSRAKEKAKQLHSERIEKNRTKAAYERAHKDAIKFNKQIDYLNALRDKKAARLAPEAFAATRETKNAARRAKRLIKSREEEIAAAKIAQNILNRAALHEMQKSHRTGEKRVYTKEEIAAAKIASRKKGRGKDKVTRARRNPDAPIRAKDNLSAHQQVGIEALKELSTTQQERRAEKVYKESQREKEALIASQHDMVRHLQSIGRRRVEKTVTRLKQAQEIHDQVKIDHYTSIAQALIERYRLD